MASGRNRESLTRPNESAALTRMHSENPIIRGTLDIGLVAGRLFVCIGVCFGQWFIGIRRLP